MAVFLLAMAVWISTRRLLGLGAEDTGPRTDADGHLQPAGPENVPARRTRPGGKSGFQVWLSQAGAAVTPSQFVTVSAGLGSLAFLVLVAISHTLAICVLPACAAALAPYGYWASARRKLAAARSSAWPDAVRYLVGVLGSGIATLHDALEQLSRSGPLPLRAPMSRYIRLASRVGDKRAFEILRDELADPISDPVLIAFEGAIEEGTETVLRVLSDLGEQISADLQLGEKVRTLQTQSRVANWGCFSMPYAALFMLCSANPTYRAFFSRPLGLVVVLLGVAVSLAGLMISRALVRPVATSRRVFVGRVTP